MNERILNALIINYSWVAIHFPKSKPLPTAKRPVTLPHNFEEILFQSSSASRDAIVRHILPTIQKNAGHCKNQSRNDFTPCDDSHRDRCDHNNDRENSNCVIPYKMSDDFIRLITSLEFCPTIPIGSELPFHLIDYSQKPGEFVMEWCVRESINLSSSKRTVKELGKSHSRSARKVHVDENVSRRREQGIVVNKGWMVKCFDRVGRNRVGTCGACR